MYKLCFRFAHRVGKTKGTSMNKVQMYRRNSQHYQKEKKIKTHTIYTRYSQSAFEAQNGKLGAYNNNSLFENHIARKVNCLKRIYFHNPKTIFFRF